MTDKVKTGGPAFPFSDIVSGMTLRDYFAAKALHGILADPEMALDDDKLAEWAYRVADTMIKARK